LANVRLRPYYRRGLGPPTEAGGVPLPHSVPQSPFVLGGVAAAPALQTGGVAAPSAVARTTAARAAAALEKARALGWGEGAGAAETAPEAAGAAGAAAPEVAGAAGAAAPELAGAAGAAAPELAGAAAPVAGAAPGAGLVTIAVPLAVGAVIVLEIWSLVSWGQFQAKLEALGYVILPSPLGVCISDCHQPAAPSFRPSPFEGPTTITGPGSFRDFPPISPEWFRPEASRRRPGPVAAPTPQTGPQAQTQTTPLPTPRRCATAEWNRLYPAMKTFCDQPRSCSIQLDNCASAIAKVAAGYGCTEVRENIQRNCYAPGDPGYKSHMQQIAEAYASLRNCLTVMSEKCS
jgi:hypothetical protein